MMDRVELVNRVLAFLGGLLLIVFSLSAPVSARESVITIMLLIGVFLLVASVAGEVTFTIKADGKPRARVTSQPSKAKKGKPEPSLLVKAAKAAAKMAGPR